MHQLSCVFFQMEPGNANALRGTFHGNVKKSLLSQGEIILADLVGLGEVGIKIILSVKPGGFPNGTVQGESPPNPEAYSLRIEHRQSSGLPCTDRADIAVGHRSDIVRGTAAEKLGFGEKLHVNL